MASNGKRMVKEDLIKKLENLPEGLEVVEANSTDEATETLSKLTVGDTVYAVPQGATYAAGTGIDITENTISVDNTVALKTDVPHLYALTFDIEDYTISETSFTATDDYITILCPYLPEIVNNMVNLKTLTKGKYFAISGNIDYSGTKSDVKYIYSDGNGNLEVDLANDEYSEFASDVNAVQAYYHQIV